MEKRKVSKLMCVLCVIFAIIGVIFISIAFNKITDYSNPDSEYSYETEYTNSYVGGDAYNYIINGTYFTAYAVMGTGSFLISALTGVTSAVLAIKKDEKPEEEQLPEL